MTQLNQQQQGLANTPATVKKEKELEFVPYGSGDKIRLSVEMVKNFIAVPTKSGKTCSDRDALKFVMMCQAKRLNPWEGDAFLIGYDGQKGPEFSLITAHQAFLKRAELQPIYDGMRSGVIVETGDGQLVDREGDFYREGENVVGGWATVYFKDRKYPCSRRIRMERFNKGFAQWAIDGAGMICKCAEADALRSSFPTMLGGLYMREEVDATAFGVVVDAPVPINRKPSLELVAQPTETERVAALSNYVPPEEERQAAMSQQREAKPEGEKRGPGRPKKETPDEAVANKTSIDALSAQADEAGTRAQRAEQTPQQSLEIYLDSAGVSWSDFRGFLISDGHYPAADSIATIDELPTEVCRKLAADAKAMSKLVKLYGGGKESVTP